MREGILHRIAQAPDLEVVGAVADGTALVERFRALAPDVVVTDHRMPGLNGLEALAEIRAIDPGAKVILLSGFDDGQLVADAIAAGAAGFLTKSLPGPELCDHIRAAAGGEPAFSSDATRLLMGQVRSAVTAPPPAPPSKKLSGRELQILRLVADGLTNAQIATKLYLSPQTVKTHLERIFSKLGVNGRAAAVSKSMSEGLLAL